jgi:hypothetical protein
MKINKCYSELSKASKFGTSTLSQSIGKEIRGSVNYSLVF